MNISKKLREIFPPRTQPDYYLLGDDTQPLSCDVFRPAPIDESDPAAVANRNTLNTRIYAVFFGTVEERGAGERFFNELSNAAVESMPPAVRAIYESELAAALDPRSGLKVRPYNEMSN